MKKYFFILCLFSTVQSANAVVVDNGIYNTDTDTGLQWLDITATAGVSYNDAITASEAYAGGGWRYATNAEIENLFSVMFDGYYSNNPNTDSSYALNSTSTGAYVDQGIDVAYFQSVFGFVNYLFEIERSVLMYIDENNDISIMGADYWNQRGDTNILGLNFENHSFNLDTPHEFFGSFLVRDASVPEPSSFALLGLGLAGLAMRRRKRKGNTCA